MTRLLDLMRPQPDLAPVDPGGSVVRGAPDRVIPMPRPKIGCHAEIELHRHDDGRWMWSVSVECDNSYSGYRVGPKWGQFSASEDDALYWAARELLGRLARNPGAETASRARIRAWAEGLC